MTLRGSALILAFLFFAINTSAQGLEDHQARDLAYPEIENALKILRSGPRLADACDMSKMTYECSFTSYCKSFTQRDKAIYLYENSEGRRIPNIALIGIYNALGKCGGGRNYQTLTEDPFLHPQKFLEPKNLQTWNAQKSRLESLYNDTKARVIEVLRARKNGANSVEIDNMILRVQTVSFVMPDIKVFQDVVGSGCEFPNAFYYPGSHALTVCPQFGNLPDASVISLMAHEMGHAIDPCNAAQDLIKTKDGYVTDYAVDLGSFIPKRNVAGQKVAASIMLNKNPLTSVIQCLQEPDSIGAKIPTAKELEAALIQEMKQDKISSPEQNSFLKRIPALYPRYGACSDFSNDGKLTESFSDWMSAEVLASKIKTIPEADKAKQFAFESQALFLGSDCPGAIEAVQERAADAVGFSGDKSCGNAFQNYERLGALSNAYPVSPDRMTKIIYAHPEIQKVLGCHPGTAKACK